MQARLRRTFLTAAAALAAASVAAQPSRPPDPALTALAAGGTVALIRHAAAPGTGDPPGFRLGECATQRNLSEAGRQQAADLGRRIRSAKIPVTEVKSSRWCRAADTARLAFPDLPTEPDPALDSFFAGRGSGPAQTARAKAAIQAWRGRPGVLVMVTHQVNITALTGLVPAEGEVVVVAPGTEGVVVLGRTRI